MMSIKGTMAKHRRHPLRTSLVSLTAVCSLAGLGVGAGLAATGGVAGAATAPVTNNIAGESGYYGADDNQTHYRFTETTVTASQSLVNLNGTASTDSPSPGVIGTELCDSNTGNVAEIGLWWNGTAYEVSYEGPGVKNYMKLPVHVDGTDPCVQSGISAPLGDNSSADAPELVGVTANNNGLVIHTGDQIYMGIYYTPSGRHFHQISFGMTDITQGWSEQAYGGSHNGLEFWEFGTGALTEQPNLTAPADNLLDTFSGNMVTCYSCASPIPIGNVKMINTGQPVYEANFVNSSSQVVMSPNNTLTIPGGSEFSLYEGSTSP